MRKHLNTFNVRVFERLASMTMHEVRNENIILLFGLLADRARAPICSHSQKVEFITFHFFFFG